MKLKSKSGGN